MADIKVQRVESSDDRSQPIFQRIEKLMARIPQRAHELFVGRGYAPGGALEDWLAAEHELCWPAAELVEREGEFELSLALPGFEAGEVSVAATPDELVVHAARTKCRDESAKDASRCLWSEFGSEEVYRRIGLAQPIEVARVSATLSHGLLKVVARKAVATLVPVPIARAA